MTQTVIFSSINEKISHWCTVIFTWKDFLMSKHLGYKCCIEVYPLTYKHTILCPMHLWIFTPVNTADLFRFRGKYYKWVACCWKSNMASAIRLQTKKKKNHPSATQAWWLNKALTLNLSCATSRLKPVAMIPLGRKESGSYSISSLFSLFPITNDASSSNSDNGSQITARVYPNLVTLERNNKKPLSTLQLQSKAQFIPTS